MLPQAQLPGRRSENFSRPRERKLLPHAQPKRSWGKSQEHILLREFWMMGSSWVLALLLYPSWSSYPHLYEVSYRSLSRYLNVHINVAKQWANRWVQGKNHLLKYQLRLLYEFYHHQSSRKPGSVNATYLVSGIQAKLGETSATGHGLFNFEDVNMQSSPFISSSIPPGDDAEERSSVNVIALVREQDLECKICMRGIQRQFSSFWGTVHPIWDGTLTFSGSDQGKISRDFIYPHLQFRSQLYQGNDPRYKIRVYFF